MKIPRDYQEAANTSLWNFIHQQPGLNPLVVEATGLGKSLNIAMFIYMWLAHYPHTRIMQVVHVKELVKGNYEELMELWPSAPAGIYSAGLNERNLRAQVTFAGIMSVHKRAASFGHIDFLLVDEAHTISDKESATYVKFIAALKEINPYLVVIGFTATAFRMSSGYLVEGELFDEVVYDIGSGESFLWAIEQGYLIKPVPKNPGFELDSDAIGIQAGDFKNNEASQAMHDQNILERAVDTTIAMGTAQDRKCWLHFCQSIEDAETVADMFTCKGYPHEAVHSKRDDRDDVIQALKTGDLLGATNMGVLTTGHNIPRIDLIGMLRLTRSPGLWVQMGGRGTRPIWLSGHDITTFDGRWASIKESGKETCLLLDFVGNTKRLGPLNYPNVPKRRGPGSGSSSMVRECPECQTYVHIGVKQCTECGHVFAPPERLSKAGASEADLVTSQIVDLTDLSQTPPPKQFEVYGVHRMVCSHHKGKNDKADTMRVDYFCGFNTFSSWVCLAHEQGSFPRRKAQQWWEAHDGYGEGPQDIEEAVEMASLLAKPLFIKVWVNTKFPEIVGHDFIGTRFELPPELGGPPLQAPEPDPFEADAQATINSTAGYGGYDYDDDIPF